MSAVPSAAAALRRIHARRLREVYRSAGWPSQDAVELDLLAAGLLERQRADSGHETVRLTAAGIVWLGEAMAANRRALSAHEALVERVAGLMLRHGRIVWTGLGLRARLPVPEGEPNRWKICRPDVFSIRHTTVAGYLEPVVHEVKVSRADLLGDLKQTDKRDAYLDVGGQCWYVLGTNARGQPIADPDEVPASCGVLVAAGEQLAVARHAPKRPVADLPFALWMALARATPWGSPQHPSDPGDDQAPLADGGG